MIDNALCAPAYVTGFGWTPLAIFNTLLLYMFEVYVRLLRAKDDGVVSEIFSVESAFVACNIVFITGGVLRVSVIRIAGCPNIGFTIVCNFNRCSSLSSMVVNGCVGFMRSRVDMLVQRIVNLLSVSILCMNFVHY